MARPGGHEGRKEKEMTTAKFFEIILQVVKSEFGYSFDNLSQSEKVNVIMIFADQITKSDKGIMNALASAVYNELSTTSAP